MSGVYKQQEWMTQILEILPISFTILAANSCSGLTPSPMRHLVAGVSLQFSEIAG